MTLIVLFFSFLQNGFNFSNSLNIIFRIPKMHYSEELLFFREHKVCKNKRAKKICDEQ